MNGYPSFYSRIALVAPSPGGIEVAITNSSAAIEDLVDNMEILDSQCSDLIKMAPDNKVHGANMGPTWVLSAPDGPHDGPMNLAIRGLHFVDGILIFQICSYLSGLLNWHIGNHRIAQMPLKQCWKIWINHYNDVIMGAAAYINLTNICSAIYSMHRSKKTSKLHVTGLCAGKFNSDRRIPCTTGQ